MGEGAETLPGFERPPVTRPEVPRPSGRLVAVQPDITAITQSFTYVVPEAWEADGRAERVAVGSLVRIDFAGRRIAGWVTAVDVDYDSSVSVAPLTKWSSVGPPASVIDLVSWAAHRWYGRPAHFLRAGSPPKMVASLPEPAPVASAPTQASSEPDAVFRRGEVTVVETPPVDRGTSMALAAAKLGRALVLVPTIADRRHVASSLRAAGVGVAEYPDQWALAAAGVDVVVGTRTAAFAPIEQLDAVLVMDEHDSAFKEERTPTWNARDVAVERARRSGGACVLASPSLSLESLEIADRRLVPERSAQRNSWPLVQVVDMRKNETPGLLSPALVDVIRSESRVACILNRKGRAQMLACSRCDALADCETCGASVHQPDEDLQCRSCGSVRPVVCRECGATKMKLIRPGISRIAEELEALARRPVIEVTADSEQSHFDGPDLILGTEAVLHRIEDASAVIFLDFDQELARPQSRAPQRAFGLLALAARRVMLAGSDGRIIIQTRRPNDAVIEAAIRGEPGRVARAQRDIRQLLKQPPYGAWALISGAGADEFIASLRLQPDVEIRQIEDRYRVSAADHEPLLSALHGAERPAGRLRVEVDPLGI